MTAFVKHDVIVKILEERLKDWKPEDFMEYVFDRMYDELSGTTPEFLQTLYAEALKHKQRREDDT